jgi:hypothetical protein
LVEVNFYAKSTGKSQITVQHNQLDNSQKAAEMRTYWSGALGRLKIHLEERK